MAMEETMNNIADVAYNVGLMGSVDPLMYKFAIFILAIFIGYYVIWSVTPALHTPLTVSYTHLTLPTKRIV